MAGLNSCNADQTRETKPVLACSAKSAARTSAFHRHCGRCCARAYCRQVYRTDPAGLTCKSMVLAFRIRVMDRLLASPSVPRDRRAPASESCNYSSPSRGGANDRFWLHAAVRKVCYWTSRPAEPSGPAFLSPNAGDESNRAKALVGTRQQRDLLAAAQVYMRAVLIHRLPPECSVRSLSPPPPSS